MRTYNHFGWWSFIFLDTMINVVIIYPVFNTEGQLEWLTTADPQRKSIIRICTSHGKWQECCTPLRPWQSQTDPWHWGWGGTLVSVSQEPPQWSAAPLRAQNQMIVKTISIMVGIGLNIMCLYCCWHTIILIYPFWSLNKQGLWWVRIWFLPYPGLLGLHIQLADLHTSEKQNQVMKELLLHTLNHLQLAVLC